MDVEKVYLIKPDSDNKRLALGLEYLLQEIDKCSKYSVETIAEADADDYRTYEGIKIYAGVRKESAWIQNREQEGVLLYHEQEPDREEGFYITTLPGQMFVIVGADATGALYGCMEFVERMRADSEIPHELYYGDAPVLKLRGPVVGLQLTKIEPPRKTYEYPITPGRFPWFYDKGLWMEFLDIMLWNRSNVLYIWSGHPFSSLVKLPDYPEALEVTEEEFQMNRELFEWLTEECDKRGIWVVLKFYNIHIPLPFAEHHGLELLQRTPNPLVADYTYKCIVEFIKSFPHIGLMVCLGEALRGYQHKTEWFLQTILPAVKQGVEEAGLTELPPLILRAHDCDANGIMDEATKQYSNLYTMWKYNGESLTTFLPAGSWQKIHQDLSSHGQTHIMNIHVLANLEPFRFAAPSFIQKCMQAGKYRQGGSGLHLYPLFYWDWPFAPDKAEPRLRQIDRDWIWYEAWLRYAWNPDRDSKMERTYWINKLSSYMGCEEKCAELILDAMEAAGEIGPRILRRVGITEGNRQTLSLGMTMQQFIHVKKFRPNYELWKSASTPGETLDEYVEKLLKGEKHWGETPLDMVAEVRHYAAMAMEQIENAKEYVMSRKDDFQYMVSDIEAINQMAQFYCSKVESAVKILLYKNTMDEKLHGDINLLLEAKDLLKKSVTHYQQLTKITEKTYLYANSMQTPQRKIPFPDGEAFCHWSQCLPQYEQEYANFEKHVNEMQNGIYPSEETEDTAKIQPLPSAKFHVLTEGYPLYEVKKGSQVFTDVPSGIQNVAPELRGLTGIAMNKEHAIQNGAKLKIDFEEDSQLLIGYFKVKGVNNKDWLRVPDLETDTHADERGGLACVFGEAVKVDNSPVVNVHAFQYEQGVHEIYMDNGAYAILGAVPASIQLKPRQAGLAGDTLDMLDWMFEE